MKRRLRKLSAGAAIPALLLGFGAAMVTTPVVVADSRAQAQTTPTTDAMQPDPAKQDQPNAEAEQAAEEPARKRKKQREADTTQAEPAQTDTTQAEPAEAERTEPAPVQETTQTEAAEPERRRKKDRDTGNATDADTAQESAPSEQRKQKREETADAPEDKKQRRKRDRDNTADAPQDNQQTTQASPRARKLLSDDRDAARLSEQDLRQRLKANRALLREEEMSRKQSRLLRERLRADREELRRRVAKREGTVVDTDRDRKKRDRQALNNDAPSESLDRRQLRRRINALRAELQDDSIADGRRARLRDRLQSDRRELREWRRERRRERREELRRARRNNEIRITIGGNFAIGIDGNVPVAEIGDDEILAQLTAGPRRRIDRRYSVREYAAHPELRDAMPGIEVDTINFAFNEYRIGPEEVDELDRLGEAIEQILAAHPDEVFVVEGHTDAVGSDAYNKDLSEKRAASVRDALLEYFVIEPQNLIAVGYGERYLRIPTEEPEQENRRVTLRRATPFLNDRRS